MLPPAIAIMGPTASGKTRLAIELGKRLDGEVISVDSALVYRGMDIGTAKPSEEERAGIPHHLLDILDPAEPYSTGRFRREALEHMESISARGRIPILAGGTMLYFNALMNGLSSLPEASPEVRQEIEREAALRGWNSLHEELGRIDPESATRIHPNDPQRIQRALEVFRLTGIPLSRLCAESRPLPPPFRIIRLVLSPASRPVLHERIRQRFLGMLDQGLVDEVRKLHERGDLNRDMPAIRAVGYRQAWQHLEGEYGLDSLAEQGVIATRQFAKRQMTWLKRETGALACDSEDSCLADRVWRDIKPLLDTQP